MLPGAFGEGSGVGLGVGFGVGLGVGDGVGFGVDVGLGAGVAAKSSPVARLSPPKVSDWIFSKLYSLI